MLQGLSIICEDGKSLITHWARQMHHLGGSVKGASSKWMKQAAEEIMLMSMNDSISISLTFEMELVTKYFDITHREHAYSGELNRRPGFVTNHLHFLFFDFITPFWMTT